ncbi:hypothetical protein ABPG77_006766 [Micractinium sp. CCAP 211/92]
MCGPLQDSRDEYERFADLVNACAGTTVGRQQAQEFFCMGNNRKPSKPDFNALHAAGLYPAAWQLPLVPAAVQEVQSSQATAHRQLRASSRAAMVGQRVSVWHRGDCWNDGTIVDTKSPRRQRKLQEAVAAIQCVYSGQPRSQLRALHCLELVGVGGEALRDVVEGWEGYTAAQQQELFDAVALTADGGDWQRLQRRLQRALQLEQ